MVFSPTFVIAPGNTNNALYPHSLISKKGATGLAVSGTALSPPGLVLLFLMGGGSSQICISVLKSTNIPVLKKHFLGVGSSKAGLLHKRL